MAPFCKPKCPFDCCNLSMPTQSRQGVKDGEVCNHSMDSTCQVGNLSNGMVWYGMAPHGMVWYGTVRNGVAWRGMVWHGMAPFAWYM